MLFGHGREVRSLLGVAELRILLHLLAHVLQIRSFDLFLFGLRFDLALGFDLRLGRALVDVVPWVGGLVMDQVLEKLVGPVQELVLIEVLPSRHSHTMAVADRCVVLGGLRHHCCFLLRGRLDHFSHDQGHLRTEIVQVQVVLFHTFLQLHHVAPDLLQGIHLHILARLAPLRKEEFELRVDHRLPARGACTDREHAALRKADRICQSHLHCSPQDAWHRPLRSCADVSYLPPQTAVASRTGESERQL
mmetsp:Transcript_46824/g.109611  ORF Transcript_46824/g.109611 Transcript_46824/m.109611 type:complete len:248 (-) Transcript_46824:2-745(-)